MSKCFTFDEWVNICKELYNLYWSCWKSCVVSGKRQECKDKCVEIVVRHGMEKYGLTKRQTLYCI
jgi:hypothetical protein